MNDTFTTIDEAVAISEACGFATYRLGKRVVCLANGDDGLVVRLLQGAPGAHTWSQMRPVAVPATV